MNDLGSAVHAISFLKCNVGEVFLKERGLGTLAIAVGDTFTSRVISLKEAEVIAIEIWRLVILKMLMILCVFLEQGV